MAFTVKIDKHELQLSARLIQSLETQWVRSTLAKSNGLDQKIHS